MNKKKIITLISVIVFLFVTAFVVTGCTTKKKLVENKVTVTFDLQGGDIVTFSPFEIKKGETIAEPSATPIKSGFTFKHWSTEVDGKEFDFSKPIEKNITLFAVWKKTPAQKVTVSFDLQGGVGTFDPIEVIKGETVTKPSTAPTKPGHTFKHWSSEINGSEFDSNKPIKKSMTLYAVWGIQTKTVNFITYEGEKMDAITLTGAPITVPQQTLTYGAMLDNPGDALFLTSVSHTFKYWSKTKNGSEFNVRTESITEDLTLHAVWEAKKYTVTFNTQYNPMTIPSQIIKYGRGVADPRFLGIVMYRPVYTFKFFSLSSDGLTGEYNLSNKVTEDLTIYAIWEKEPVKQVATGKNHSLILTENGEVYAFGSNWCGQLGLGVNSVLDKRLVPIKIDSVHYNNKKIIQVAAGGDQSFIITEDKKEVYAFGSNLFGQLGLGDRNNRNVPTKIDSTHYGDKKITQISAGGSHSLILTEDGEVYAFGKNDEGQLGLGDRNNRNVPTKI